MTEPCTLWGVICINGQAIPGRFLMDGRFTSMICAALLLYSNIVTRQIWFSDKLHYVFSCGVGWMPYASPQAKVCGLVGLSSCCECVRCGKLHLEDLTIALLK